ncbi:MAG: ATP-binding cassette domain-containing protein, partial [Pseudomonadales bacterium]|nr:ATP-binding cassette domain-containing protein [Pseudomonadales bacterium]
LIDAAEYVYAHDFILTLADQYQFELKNNGSNLSAGQAQLISFARSVAQGGQVMMLDEATSSVDSITENLIQKAIGRLFEEKTVIAIAHRLSTIRHSDQILVLNRGKIVERGNHQDLLAMGGVYARLLTDKDNIEDDEGVLMPEGA